jgi:hypothetical protein
MPKRKTDGLTKSQRYRLKDVMAYRKLKAEYARTPAERAKRVAYMRIWREKNRERHNELARQSHQRNKHKHVDRNRSLALVAKFGITLSDKQAMVDAQNGLCAICAGAFKTSRDRHVDHCHSSNAIRGILCHVCNTRLGWYERHRASVHLYLGDSK